MHRNKTTGFNLKKLKKQSTRYNAQLDHPMDTVEFQWILDKAGVALCAADARAAGYQVRNGEIDVKELLDAVRASNSSIASNKRVLFTNATTRSCSPRLSSKFDISNHSRKSTRVHNKTRLSMED